jgi:hypothetical protein
MKLAMKPKGKLVWLVNVTIGEDSLMYQFPTQEEQMKMVKEIENKVDGCIYALTPVELISEEKSKKNQIQSINK